MGYQTRTEIKSAIQAKHAVLSTDFSAVFRSGTFVAYK